MGSDINVYTPYVQNQLLKVFRLWGLPWPRRDDGGASLQDQNEKLYGQVFELAETPANLVAFVNAEVKLQLQRETMEKVEQTPASLKGKGQRAGEVERPKIRPYIHPVSERQNRIKKEIHDAHSQSQSQEEPITEETSVLEWDPITPSSLSPDDIWSKNRTFSSEVTPPSSTDSSRAVSNNVSPTKRYSEPSEPTTPSKRHKQKQEGVPNSYLAGEDYVSEEEEEEEWECNEGERVVSSPFRSTAVKLSQLSLASRRLEKQKDIENVDDEPMVVGLVDPRTEVMEVDAPSEPASTLKQGVWEPVPALTQGERAVLVLPDNSYQATLDKHDVKFHIQWELQRILGKYSPLTWTDFNADDTKPLWDITASEAASRIQEVVEGVYLRKLKSQGLWTPASSIQNAGLAVVNDREKRLLAEVDREEESIRAGKHEGLLSDDAKWAHGGRISYIIEVTAVENPRKEQGVGLVPLPCPTQAVHVMDDDQDSDSNPSPFRTTSTTVKVASNETLPFTMKLQRAAMSGKSTRLARRFGSRRVLTFKYKSPRHADERQHLFELFHGRQFLLFGRVYTAVWSPPDRDSVFAVEVGQSQAMAKWASRPQLLFSDSEPAVSLPPSAIQVIDDIVVDGLRGSASTEQTLTDGCGLMTESLARQIGARFQSPKGRPFVVQIRLGGAKGLLALMTEGQEAEYHGKQVILRQSMVKSISTSKDPSLFVIDVLRCGGDTLRLGASISPESIICLHHGGVSRQLILEMARMNLDQLRLDLHPDPQDGETPESAVNRLTTMVYRYGGVGLDRDKRVCAQQGKSTQVAGLVLRTKESADADEEDKMASMADKIDPREKYDIDPVSGQPGSLAESLYMALCAGFHPDTSDYATRKLNALVDQQVDQLVNDYRIPIEQSVSAFIVPDSLGILAPDEIFCSFSGAGPIDPDTRCPTSHLTGAVLVFRSPCKLPTDIRKFKAVYRPELCHLKDCIIMSASSSLCDRSPASFLSGGDYDGDTATVIYDPKIVAQFNNADDQFATTPETFEEENFEKGLVKGKELLAQLDGADDDTLIRNYQSFLLGSILDEKIPGIYSLFHDMAIYTLEYDHPETIRLARMFCLVLDARKSGLKVKPEVLQNDRRTYTGDLEWKGAIKKQTDIPARNKDFKSRPRHLRKFIMDRLRSEATKHGQEIKDAFLKEAPKRSHHATKLLAETYEWEYLRRDDERSPPSRIKQLQSLEKHVTTCVELWVVLRRSSLCAEKPVEQHYREYTTPKSISLRPHSSNLFAPRNEQDNIILQAQTRALARVWRDLLPLSQVDELCRSVDEQRILLISCAAAKLQPYHQTFLFDVDFETTLFMNAKQQGSTSTVSLDSMMNLKPAWKAGKKIETIC